MTWANKPYQDLLAFYEFLAFWEFQELSDWHVRWTKQVGILGFLGISGTFLSTAWMTWANKPYQDLLAFYEFLAFWEFQELSDWHVRWTRQVGILGFLGISGTF